ncbi:MAG: metallophosphoesterase [Gammaproteobacteria bacterium]|nr:metallophosphoesterase [Gammaproteobacteria bacterium]
MKIGIISDSHDHMDNIRKAVEIFRQRGVPLVIHAGDFVNPASIKLFKGLNLVGIFGNNDGDRFRLMKAFQSIKGDLKGDFCELERDGLRFAVYHGTESQLQDALAQCGKYDVVITGHTHKLESTTVGDTVVINPGTAHGFGGKATVAIFDTDKKEPEFVEL